VSGADQQGAGDASACNYRLGQEEVTLFGEPAGPSRAVSAYLITASARVCITWRPDPTGQIEARTTAHLSGTGAGPGRRGRWRGELMDSMLPVMALEIAVFLAFSAALWLLVIKHADTEWDARGAAG
jgi:hypothetical protein